MQDKLTSQLVQDKIKKMMENRKKNVKRDNSQLSKRMKSNVVECEYQDNEQQDGENKPKSSMRMRRPGSGRKPTETVNSMTTSSSGKQQIQVRPFILSAFEHGVKLKQFLKTSFIQRDGYLQELLNSQLFILSLLSKLKKIDQDKYPELVEKEIIDKIKKIKIIENQKKACEAAQSKISRIIQERLKALSKY